MTTSFDPLAIFDGFPPPAPDAKATNPKLPNHCLRCGAYEVSDGRTPDECYCEGCGVRMAWADEPGHFGWIIP